MAEAIVIEANLYRDDAGNRPLPRLIGPFPDRASAVKYLDSLGPLWGDFNLALIYTPSSADSEAGGS